MLMKMMAHESSGNYLPSLRAEPECCDHWTLRRLQWNQSESLCRHHALATDCVNNANIYHITVM